MGWALQGKLLGLFRNFIDLNRVVRLVHKLSNNRLHTPSSQGFNITRSEALVQYLLYHVPPNISIGLLPIFDKSFGLSSRSEFLVTRATLLRNFSLGTACTANMRKLAMVPSVLDGCSAYRYKS